MSLSRNIFFSVTSHCKLFGLFAVKWKCHCVGAKFTTTSISHNFVSRFRRNFILWAITCRKMLQFGIIILHEHFTVNIYLTKSIVSFGLKRILKGLICSLCSLFWNVGNIKHIGKQQRRYHGERFPSIKGEQKQTSRP